MVTRAEALTALTRSLARHSGFSPGRLSAATPRLALGKAYELYCLGMLVAQLESDESFTYNFAGSSVIRFRLGHGPINEERAHINVLRSGVHVGTLWTDIQFVSRSACDKVCISADQPLPGDRHELDIVLVKPGVYGSPCHRDIFMGVECKERQVFDNTLLREVLGVRSEMAINSRPTPAVPFGLEEWGTVSADPPSWMCVCSPAISLVSCPAQATFYGIKFRCF